MSLITVINGINLQNRSSMCRYDVVTIMGISGQKHKKECAKAGCVYQKANGTLHVHYYCGEDKRYWNV